MDVLWTSAKHIAQSDGRKEDWLYVMDVYKSIGGTEVALMIQANGKRHEILGEAGSDGILVCNSVGELDVIDKSIYKKARKKFLKRDITGATPMQKSLSKDGRQFNATIYKDAKLS
ncbi:hypothetical protein M3_0220 [Lysinibacillus phage vB_LfM_LysYB1]|nr:hypothetical protein M3_0220 [Lysinibacillus phage vB_LfM_LysYB1]WAB25268.1 hypothetical protein M5_0090 [Lysinibacillus phage vB_LfM_LysYB2]